MWLLIRVWRGWSLIKMLKGTFAIHVTINLKRNSKKKNLSSLFIFSICNLGLFIKDISSCTIAYNSILSSKEIFYQVQEEKFSSTLLDYFHYYISLKIFNCYNKFRLLFKIVQYIRVHLSRIDCIHRNSFEMKKKSRYSKRLIEITIRY